MAELLKFRGQRWTLEDAGHRLVVENAWSWAGVTQERVTLDGAVLHQSVDASFPLRWTTVIETLWPPAGKTLFVQWKSGLMSVNSRALMDGRPLRWTDFEEGLWQGAHGVWPD
jgi:hypothetical protein